MPSYLLKADDSPESQPFCQILLLVLHSILEVHSFDFEISRNACPELVDLWISLTLQKIELLIQELSEILRRNKRYFSAYWSAPGFGPLWNCVCNEVVNPCRYVMEARIRAIRDKGYYQPIHARINRLHPEPHEKEAILQTLIECSHLQLSRERPYEEQLQKLEKTFWVETEPEDYLLMFTYDCEAALTESELVQDGHIVLQVKTLAHFEPMSYC